MKVSVVGASGYTGGELLRILLNHPQFKLDLVCANTNKGEEITKFHPSLQELSERNFDEVNIEKLNKSELIFLALPHGESGKLAKQISPKLKIVDLGADHRLDSAAAWQKYYAGEYSGSWFYSIPELVDHEQLKGETKVANPGCYATAISLAIAPVLDLVDASDLVTVAASGTTGAGRSAKMEQLGSEVMNNLSSYKFGGLHQHTPEIEQTLNKQLLRFKNTKSSSAIEKAVKVSFTPVLAPMPRGILATVTAKVNDAELNASSSAQLIENFRSRFTDLYSTTPFVKILSNQAMPNTKSVLGTNNVHIQLAIDAHTNRLVVSCAIDNLGKGAAGQAIQNANIMCGLPQDAGLNLVGF